MQENMGSFDEKMIIYLRSDCRSPDSQRHLIAAHKSERKTERQFLLG